MRIHPTCLSLVFAGLIAAAFTAGQLVGTRGAAASAAEPGALAVPQGGRGTRPPLGDPSADPPASAPTAPPLVYGESGGSSGEANGFIAVTGSYGVGTSVLYVLDTVNRQLAVYEARGGSENSRRLVFVGARRIDLDLQLEGYNDDSDFSYGELSERFARRGAAAGDGSGASLPPGALAPKTGAGGDGR